MSYWIKVSVDLGKMWVHNPDDRKYVSIYRTPVMHCLSVCLSVLRSVIGACKHVFKKEKCHNFPDTHLFPL